MSTNKSAIVAMIDSALVVAYQAADKGGKAKIRTALQSAKDNAVEALDLQAALDAKATFQACVASSGPVTPESAPVNITLANRAATLRRAAALIESGSVTPDGLDVTGLDYGTVIDGTADEAAATKIASAKITRSGEQHDIGAVIVRVFGPVEVGTVLTVAEVVRLGEVEGYRPSPGAVSNKITTGHPMIEKISADTEGPLRARRV